MHNCFVLIPVKIFWNSRNQKTAVRQDGAIGSGDFFKITQNYPKHYSFRIVRSVGNIVLHVISTKIANSYHTPIFSFFNKNHKGI